MSDSYSLDDLIAFFSVARGGILLQKKLVRALTTYFHEVLKVESEADIEMVGKDGFAEAIVYCGED